MNTKEVKAMASKLNAKSQEVKQIEARLAETRQLARLPKGETVKKNLVQETFGNVAVRVDDDDVPRARTYTVEEHKVPAEQDPLELIRQQRQEELGRAHLDDRTPAVGEFDKRIAEIEGARAALPILEEQLARTKEEEQDLRHELHREAVVPMLQQQFSDSEKGFAEYVEGLRVKLGEMHAISQLASALRVGPGAQLTYKYGRYVEGIRTGLLVSQANGIYPPSWMMSGAPANLPSAATKYAEILTELAELGITV